MWQLSVIEVKRTVNDISFFTLLSGHKQLRERRNKLFALKQETGNCPQWPTIKVILLPYFSFDLIKFKSDNYHCSFDVW